MKKFVALLLLILLVCPSSVFAYSRESSWNEGDLEMDGDSIDGSRLYGLRFDPDNDNINEITMNTSGSLTLGNITIPATDGTNGQVLKTNGSGALTWQDDAGGVTDHGALTGLADDDHTAYLLQTEIDTEAELETVLTDVTNVIVSTEIDTIAEIETIAAGVNIIVSTEIDAEAELEALLADVSNVYTNNDTLPVKHKYGVTFDGGGAVPNAGTVRYTRVPVACTITKVTIMADQSGSAVVDIWKDTLANYPPTNADTITAGAEPTLSSASIAEDSTLTGWTTSITAGDTLGFNLDSCTTSTVVHVVLECTE